MHNDYNYMIIAHTTPVIISFLFRVFNTINKELLVFRNESRANTKNER